MKILFVAWQQPDSSEWIPVARLEQEGALFKFRYTRGAYRAKEFLPFSGLDDLQAQYRSHHLFPLFTNRLLPKSRPEFKDYMRWMGLSHVDADPMSMLSLSGGMRGTDSIELFAPPDVSEGSYRLSFFARGIRHMASESATAVNRAKPGDRLYLLEDRQNEADPFALALRTADPLFFVGYCPKYYAKDLGNLLDASPLSIDVRVTSCNDDAPANMRLLCSVKAPLPEGFDPLSNNSDYDPVSDDVPDSWKLLDFSL